MLDAGRRTAAAERARRHRARERAGKVVLNVEIDEVAVAELCVAAGLLDGQADDRRALAHAVEQLLGALAGT
jgi:hypothetical protein